MKLGLLRQFSQTVSSINMRTRREHDSLMSKVLQNRAALRHVHSVVESIESKMHGIEETSRANFEAMSAKCDATAVSVLSLRTLGQQILTFLSTFPQEIRDLLQSIVQADWRTYQAVLHLQQCLARSPTSVHESNIRFTDVLGEYRELPYEFFSRWEVCIPFALDQIIPLSNRLQQPFEGFLRSQFKGKPGENKVLDGSFHLLDVSNGRAIIAKENWTRSVS